jgi:HEAT repeat protein
MGCGVAVAGLAVRQAEPRFDGRPLAVWLAEADASQAPPTRERAEAAVRHIGARALPGLLADLRAVDSRWEETLRELLERQSWIRVTRPSAWERHHRGLTGLRVLGPVAAPLIGDLRPLVGPRGLHVVTALASIGAPAMPALLDTLGHSNELVRAVTARALALAVSDRLLPRDLATSAVPVLVRNLRADRNRELRGYPLFALATLRAFPDLCVPALIEGLDDSNPRMRASSAEALSAFGVEARLAIPALRKLLDDPEETARHAATLALAVIQPNANLRSSAPGHREPSAPVPQPPSLTPQP